MEHMILEIANDYSTITLDDGRKFAINPIDLSAAVGWLPTNYVTVKQFVSGAYRLTHVDYNVSIEASLVPNPKDTKKGKHAR
ncbi:MAG TPA: hypothetical protein VNL17_12790 [Verrucomicrobiae bacterium]|nr:hypothetical protein [Verrucomicrobiae bacterium]